MSACEKCWADATRAARMFGGFQADHYGRLLEELLDRPCVNRPCANPSYASAPVDNSTDGNDPSRPAS